MTLEEFSSGYYRMEMTIQPYEDGPMIEQGLYDIINKHIYARTNAPVTMRVGLDRAPYFAVSGEGGVPTDVLAIPRDWMDDMEIHDGWEPRNVFVLRPEHSYILNQSITLGERFDSHNVNTEE